MDRKTELYTIIGIVLAALGLLAAWLALPPFQSFANTLLANPLFWPLVGVLIVLALLLPFTDLRAVVARLRAWLPGRKPERAYLHAVYQELNRTPALLVIGGRDDAYRELQLIETFSALTLHSEDGPTPSRRSADVPDAAMLDNLSIEPLSELHQRSGRIGRRRRTPAERRNYAIFWLLAQLPLLVVTAALGFRLLWSAQSGWQLGWLRVGGALLLTALWFLAARWLHRSLLPALQQRWLARRACSADPGTPGAEIWGHHRLLIRGTPGSGKTTLLRHSAVVCAGERLGLPRGQERMRVRDAYGWPDCPFPIYIPLRALQVAAVHASGSLLESYAEILRVPSFLGKALPECDAAFFMRRAEHGSCLFLIDAFDELRDANQRQRLGRLIAALPPGPPRHPNRIVVTSRIAGYEGQLRDKDFAHYRLDDLDEQQSAAFVRARYTALGPRDAEQRARRLIERLPSNPGLRRLSRNPLLLSLAVSLHYRQGGRELPQERHLLYEKAVEMLAYEWERFRDNEAGLEPIDARDDLSAKERLDLLAELAWAMFEDSLGNTSDTARAVVRGARALDVLAATLQGIPSVGAAKSAAERERHCHSEAERWLRNLNERGGLLQEVGNVPGSSEVEIQFAHLSFQEYLAARAVGEATDEQRFRRLLQRWDDANWREVLLLHAASRTDATPVVRHLLGQQLAGLLLAGYVLVERPRKLDQQLLSQTQARLTMLVLATADTEEPVALEALQVLADAAVLPERAALFEAAVDAPLPAVRARLIELLAGAGPNQPAPVPAPDDLRDLALRVLEHEQDFRPRLAAGFSLAHNDPRYAGDGWIPDLVEVSAGSFVMGSNDIDESADPDEKLERQLELPTYFIGKTPVTNAQWRRFVEAGGYTMQRYWTKAGWRWVRDESVGIGWRWIERLRRSSTPITQPEYWANELFNGDNQPVVGVSWFEAVAYCRWLSDVTKQEFYLPSEAEWEKAARGPHGQLYPWGNEWQDGCCNNRDAGIGRPSPVGSFPAGASPYGALDMAGNVLEWCATKYGKQYPYELEDERDKRYLEGAEARWIRGGSYGGSQKGVRGAYRFNDGPRLRFNFIGLRVASRSPRPNAES